MTDKPPIGDFRSKPGNTPRAEPKPPAVDSAAEAEPPAEATPAERYRKRLQEAKIPLADAHAIYDAVLDKGYYEEYVRIRDRRAVLRTRSYEEQLRVQTALEFQQPRTHLGHEELISRYNLAASLYEWEGRPLKHETDADFEAILSKIRKMPQPLVALLYDSLARFDQKVMLVFSEGATSSF